MSNRMMLRLRPLALSLLVLAATGVGMVASQHEVMPAALLAAGLGARPAAPLMLAADATPSTVPDVLNYQGVVRDANGQPLANGEYNLTFRLYDGVASVNPPLWEEQHNGVTVREGRFGVTLGATNPLAASLFSASPDRFVGVTVQGFAEMQPRLRLASVPYAVHAEDSFDGVPVGGVIDWWRPDNSFPVPDGYQICDGGTVTDPKSPLNGKPLPDLRGKFIRGANDVNGIGTTGGAESHTHAVTANAQNLTTAIDGAHSHTGLSGRTGKITSAIGAGDPDPGTGAYAVRDDNSGWNNNHNHLRVDADAGVEGHHYHSLDGSGSASANGSAHSHAFSVPSQTVTSGAASSLPPYYGLLKLCRIR